MWGVGFYNTPLFTSTEKGGEINRYQGDERCKEEENYKKENSENSLKKRK
jgi:hypothetical protein